jgi:hypothetical protein
MRRPNMLRFNSWMNDCVLFLEDLPNVTMFDKRLVARVRLMNIAEEFASSFSLDDPDNKSIFLDSRTQRTMQAFERRLKSWKESLDLDVMNGKESRGPTYIGLERKLKFNSLNVDVILPN